MKVSTRIASAALAFGILATSAAPVFANEAKVIANISADASVTASTETKPVDLVCMQNGVGTREDAIIAALYTYHTNAKTALATRRDALKAAWTISDKDARKEAIRKASSDFKGTWKKERKTLNAAKKAVWKKFKEIRKTCNDRGEGEDHGNDRDL